MSDQSYKWFSDRIRDKRLTQRAVAKAMDMDPSTLSLLLHGKRRMRVEQAAELARILGVAVNEVIRHGGADVRETQGNAPAALPVVGSVDADNRVRLDWNNKRGQQFRARGAYPSTAVAVQWRTAQTKSSIWDGWFAVVTPPAPADAREMDDKLCIVGLAGEGGALLRRVHRGYTDGKFTLLDFHGEPIYDADVEWFAPVLGIYPV